MDSTLGGSILSNIEGGAAGEYLAAPQGTSWETRANPTRDLP
jgi:hypothetical protein